MFFSLREFIYTIFGLTRKEIGHDFPTFPKFGTILAIGRSDRDGVEAGGGSDRRSGRGGAMDAQVDGGVLFFHVDVFVFLDVDSFFFDFRRAGSRSHFFFFRTVGLLTQHLSARRVNYTT